MASSFEIRNVRYESIHDVSTEHWTWFFDAACPEDGDVILDCGCGYAACTRELLERFTNESFIIDLVDESDFQLERAKKELEQLSRANVQIQYIKSGVGKNWNPSRKYHKIFLKMVLHEHPLAEQSVILNAIYDLLRPGGILILWDISLNSDIADFFRSVIRKKDELLGFDSLVQRRHFATKEEIICNVAKSKFKTLELIRQFHCKCYSDRRIQDEFKNDMEKYQLWITEIDLLYSQLGTKAKKELSFKRYFNHPDAMQTPVVDDNGDHRLFTIDRSIWCLQRADKLSLINRKIGIKSIQTHLAPSARRSDLPEIFLNAVKEGLIVLNDHKLLNNHHGLIRVTTFEVGDKGKRMLKPEGFDYIYDFRELAHSNYFVSQLADAYFRHMFNIYNNKYIHKETGWTTLTEYLNKRGSRTNECSWLRILVAKGDQPQELEIRVTLCIGEIETLSDIFDINIEKFQSVKDDIHKIEPPINTSNTNSGSYRLEYKGESVDSIATTKVNDSHFFSTDQALYPDLNVNIGRWRNETFSDLPYEALVNFAVFYFDARLGCGYYILPPAPLTNSDHRSEEVAIFFSSDSKLSTVEENLLLAFTSKIWGDLRGVESFCSEYSFINTAYRDEIRSNSTVRQHFIQNIFFPLMLDKNCENIQLSELINKDNKDKTSDTFNEWTMLHNTVTSKDIPTLVKYLHHHNSGITKAEHLIAEDIIHSLKNYLTIESDYTIFVTLVERAKRNAARGGVIFAEYITLLNFALSCFNNSDIKGAIQKCEFIYKNLDNLLKKSRDIIKDYCNSIIKLKETDFICNSYSFKKEYYFNVSEFIAAIDQLRINAENKNTGNLPKIKIQYIEDGNSCKVIWLEHTNNDEWDFKQFKNATLESVLDQNKGGIFRGLPCIILFGLENKATKIEVLFDETWYSLLPINDSTIKKENNFKEFNYGIRFTFS